MKKTIIIISIVMLALCLGETGFAQKNRSAKKTAGNIKAKPAPEPNFTASRKSDKSPNAGICAEATEPGTEAGRGAGLGTGAGESVTSSVKSPVSGATVKPKRLPLQNQELNIISKSSHKYTDLARENGITGKVTLRVTFLSTCKIGKIYPISGLPYGLTEEAVKAARQIKFEPLIKNGVPLTTTKTLTYNFSLY